MMKNARSRIAVVSCSLGFLLAAGTHAFADFDPPVKKKVDCSKPENKNKPACKPSNSATDDEIYNAGYWMARSGQYAEALAVFRMAANQNDPRILTGLGFTTRKLGNVDAAFAYYDRALAQAPNLVLTRAYLGEAHLMKGDLAAAQHQLSEIQGRCGTSCEAYAQLAGHIAAYTAKAPKG
jgi:tetratricopeptide (TPR) repeat protein